MDNDILASAVNFNNIFPPIAGPIELLFSWNDENGPAADLSYEIHTVDIEGTVATARLETDNWHGHRFTDLFTLLRLDGEWKIISKVFHVHGE